jgi:hypothetical protein
MLATSATMSRKSKVVLLAFVLLIGGLWSISTPTAHADSLTSYCNYVWLQPYGQYGDRCDQSEQYAAPYAALRVVTHERAGCVRALGYYGEPRTSWVCVTKESVGVVNLPREYGALYRGSIRNNNTINGGRFDGTTLCCYS